MNSKSEFSIVVSASPLSQGMASALAFCLECEAAQQPLSGVFFHGEAAAVANAYMLPLEDQPHFGKLWKTFAARTQVPLTVCIASSERRGVLDQSEAKQRGFVAMNVADGFEIGGLGLLNQTFVDSSHVIRFK